MVFDTDDSRQISRRSLLGGVGTTGLLLASPGFGSTAALPTLDDCEYSSPCDRYWRCYVPDEADDETIVDTDDASKTHELGPNAEYDYLHEEANVQVGAVYRGNNDSSGCPPTWDLYVAWQGFMEDLEHPVIEDRDDAEREEHYEYIGEEPDRELIGNPGHVMDITIDGGQGADPHLGQAGAPAQIWQSDLDSAPDVSDTDEARDELTDRYESEGIPETDDPGASLAASSLTTLISAGVSASWAGPYGTAAGVGISLAAAGWNYVHSTPVGTADEFQIDPSHATDLMDVDRREQIGSDAEGLGDDVMFFRYPSVAVRNDGERPAGELREFSVSAELTMDSSVLAGSEHQHRNPSASVTVQYREDRPSRLRGEVEWDVLRGGVYEVWNADGQELAELEVATGDVEFDVWVSEEEFPLEVRHQSSGDVARTIEVSDLDASLEPYETIRQTFDITYTEDGDDGNDGDDGDDCDDGTWSGDAGDCDGDDGGGDGWSGSQNGGSTDGGDSSDSGGGDDGGNSGGSGGGGGGSGGGGGWSGSSGGGSSYSGGGDDAFSGDGSSDDGGSDDGSDDGGLVDDVTDAVDDAVDTIWPF